MKTLILASASPRRKELLERMGLDFTVVPSRGEELITKEAPWEAVEELSRQKAEEVFAVCAAERKEEEMVVIGSDTVVALGDAVLGKPRDEAEAFSMLKSLQGQSHKVYTGVSIITGGRNPAAEEKGTAEVAESARTATFHGYTEVAVFPMEDWEIRDYVAKGESLDKAGAYGIQGAYSVYVKGIRGDYNNVLGLPVSELYQRLKRMGLWPLLPKR